MNRKPGLDPWNIVLGVAMLVMYGAIIWLSVTPDDTIARWLGVMP